MEVPHLPCLSKVHNVLVRFSLSIDTGFRTLHRQSKDIYYNESVLVNLALKHTHDLQVAARFRVHGHLQQGEGRDPYTAELSAKDLD